MTEQNKQSDTPAPSQLAVCRECAGRGKVIYDGDCYEDCETCKGDRFLEVLSPQDHVTGDNQPRYTTKRLHDEIAKARAYGLEMAAQLIDANIIQDTSSGKVLAPRQDGNRDGLHYAAAIRALATTEGSDNG